RDHHAVLPAAVHRLHGRDDPLAAGRPVGGGPDGQASHQGGGQALRYRIPAQALVEVNPPAPSPTDEGEHDMSESMKVFLFFCFMGAAYKLRVRFGKKPIELDQQAKDAADARGEELGGMAAKKWLSR